MDCMRWYLGPSSKKNMPMMMKKMHTCFHGVVICVVLTMLCSTDIQKVNERAKSNNKLQIKTVFVFFCHCESKERRKMFGNAMFGF